MGGETKDPKEFLFKVSLNTQPLKHLLLLKKIYYSYMQVKSWVHEYQENKKLKSVRYMEDGRFINK